MSGTGVALPSTAVLLARALWRRCPRCGSGRLFQRWSRMVERCPRCAYRFEREEGFFLGAYVVNLVVTQIALVVTIVVSFVLTVPDPPVARLAAIGVAVGVTVPIVFYPFSKTVWTAIDLAMQRKG